MPDSLTNVAIIGAGPYGLSIAAHLRKYGVSFRIFGTPMQSWRDRMPKGMFLKSDGFASSLFDPDATFTLAHYCAENQLPYEDVGLPVPIETFIAYGMEFQRRLVPELEQTNIVGLRQAPEGFELTTIDGHHLRAKRVVLAVGITHFGYMPPLLRDLPREFVTHSSEHNDPSSFRGRRVAVIGAGASAVDLAALLREVGADPHLIARREAISFHEPSSEPRPLVDRIRAPRSGLGLGWRSRLCTDIPLVFHAMPEGLRLRAVRRHLGPAPGWFVKDKVVGRIPMHMGKTLRSAAVEQGQVRLTYTGKDGRESSLSVDHVIAACGYRVSLQRLKFLDDRLQQRLQVVEDSPVLKSNFESSVPGLFMVGLASANSFGPLTRFAYGAGFTAKRLSRHLATRHQVTPVSLRRNMSQ